MTSVIWQFNWYFSCFLMNNSIENRFKKIQWTFGGQTKSKCHKCWSFWPETKERFIREDTSTVFNKIWIRFSSYLGTTTNGVINMSSVFSEFRFTWNWVKSSSNFFRSNTKCPKQYCVLYNSPFRSILKHSAKPPKSYELPLNQAAGTFPHESTTIEQ